MSKWVQQHSIEVWSILKRQCVLRRKRKIVIRYGKIMTWIDGNAAHTHTHSQRTQSAIQFSFNVSTPLVFFSPLYSNHTNILSGNSRYSNKKNCSFLRCFQPSPESNWQIAFSNAQKRCCTQYFHIILFAFWFIGIANAISHMNKM